MFAVDFGPKGKFSLVLGFESLLFVPPGPATIEVIPNIRRADDWHFSPQITLHLHLHVICLANHASEHTKTFAIKAKYSTNFLIFTPIPISPKVGEGVNACEIFPTSLAKTFLEKNAALKIIKV